MFASSVQTKGSPDVLRRTFSPKLCRLHLYCGIQPLSTSDKMLYSGCVMCLCTTVFSDVSVLSLSLSPSLSLSLSVFLSSSHPSLQYGKAEEMAITLAQSLGQNIGIFSDKKRILNGTLL